MHSARALPPGGVARGGRPGIGSAALPRTVGEAAQLRTGRSNVRTELVPAMRMDSTAVLSAVSLTPPKAYEALLDRTGKQTYPPELRSMLVNLLRADKSIGSGVSVAELTCINE